MGETNCKRKYGWSRILEIFEESNNRLSSIRVMNFIIVLTVMINWTAANFSSGKLQPLDPSTLTLVLGSMGIKWGQKFAEKEREK